MCRVEPGGTTLGKQSADAVRSRVLWGRLVVVQTVQRLITNFVWDDFAFVVVAGLRFVARVHVVGVLRPHCVPWMRAEAVVASVVAVLLVMFVEQHFVVLLDAR